jgi:hypothetical protein
MRPGRLSGEVVMRNYLLVGTLLAAALMLAGCSDRHDWNGSGPVVSERREVEPFESIVMEGAAKLEITVGESPSVEVSGPEKAVAHVQTRVEDNTLHIKGRARDWVVRNDSSRLTIKITLPRLQALSLQGGNDVRLAGLSGGATTIRAEGAANIDGHGRLDQLTVRMSGAGHADLSRLAASEAKVTVDGVGSVVVNARDALDATMNGVGAIFYTGTPSRVSTRMNGLGTIAQREDRARDGVGSDAGAPERAEPIDPESQPLEHEDPKAEPVNRKSGHTIVI